MKKKIESFERICDICNKKIVDKRKDFSCIKCGLKDLCQDCRFALIRNRKNPLKTYCYEFERKGFLCKRCVDELIKREKGV